MHDGAYINIQVSRRFDAPAERVFDAWFDTKTVGQWLFATPTGQVIRVEIDPRVGGRYVIVDRRPDGDAEHYGTYVEIDRPRRLAFRFSVDKHDRNGDLVSIEIAPIDGGCELTLTHEMAAKWADWVDQTTKGWTDILESLARTLQS